MGGIGQPERATQNRVILLFRDELGYRYLGDWTDRDGNSNIEDGILTTYLTRSGYTAAQISVALTSCAPRQTITAVASTPTIRRSIACCPTTSPRHRRVEPRRSRSAFRTST